MMLAVVAPVLATTPAQAQEGSGFLGLLSRPVTQPAPPRSALALLPPATMATTESLIAIARASRLGASVEAPGRIRARAPPSRAAVARAGSQRQKELRQEAASRRDPPQPRVP